MRVLQHVLDLENRMFVWLDNFLGEGQPSALRSGFSQVVSLPAWSFT